MATMYATTAIPACGLHATPRLERSSFFGAVPAKTCELPQKKHSAKKMCAASEMLEVTRVSSPATKGSASSEAASGIDEDFPDSIEPMGMFFKFPASTRVPLAVGQNIVGAPPGGTPSEADSLVLKWNNVLLQAVRNTYAAGSPSIPGPPVAARAFGVFNACLFDAWAAYETKAEGIAWPYTLRRPSSEQTVANKSIAISYAAELAISTLFPTEAGNAKVFLESLKLEIPSVSDGVTPDKLGNLAATFVLQKFANDGSNFPTYTDTTSYRTFNDNNSDRIRNPDRWTPVSSFVNLGGRLNQDGFLLPHWGLANKVSFALKNASEFRPPPSWTPKDNPEEYNAQIDEILGFSKTIGEGGAEGDRLRAVAEYWADGPNNETAPGIHLLQASFISRRDCHDLDTDIKFFTILGGTLQDCAIAAWDAKRFYDNARMITPIRILRGKQMIKTWGGPGGGLVEVEAKKWVSYLPNPPFPDHISGHATFAGGAAKVFQEFTGNDNYGEEFFFKKGTSLIEPGFPKTDVHLKWETHTEAKEENGLSRLYGGIHWSKANTDGQETGSKVGGKVFHFVTKTLLKE